MRTIMVAMWVVVAAVGGRAADPEPAKTTLVEPKILLWQAALAPDGKEVVTVTGEERTLRWWDVATGKARTWEKGGTDAGSVVFMPDGKSVLVGRRDGFVSHHEIGTGRELARIKMSEPGKEKEPFFPLATGSYGDATFDLNSDGSLIALDNPNAMTVSLVKWPAGTAAAHLRNVARDGEAWASPVRFGLGGKTLYCLCEGEARGFVAVWDLATQKQTQTLVASRPISTMNVSHDGRWIGVSGGFNRTVTVWDAKADFKQTNLPHLGDNCKSIGFSRDGKRVAAVSTYSMSKKGAKATIWDLETRRAVRSWDVSDDYYHGGIVFFSLDGRTLYTAGQRNGLAAWTLSAPAK